MAPFRVLTPEGNQLPFDMAPTEGNEMDELKKRIEMYTDRDPGDENDFRVRLADGHKLPRLIVCDHPWAEDDRVLVNYAWMDEDGNLHGI